MIELFLFYHGSETTRVAQSAGIQGIVVDCESLDKYGRQKGYDTEINAYHPSDVARVRREARDLLVICRVNGFPLGSMQPADGPGVIEDTLAAVQAGADEILLPMVRSLSQVEQVLEVIAGRAKLSLMLETEWAVEHAEQLDQFPLRRVFVGLNDLMIERGSRHLFENLWNGTVSTIRNRIRAASFGFGGLTLPDRGHPIPCELLMSEMARLGCDVTFLRRSFYRDLKSSAASPRECVEAIQSAWDRLVNRSAVEIEADHQKLWKMLEDQLYPSAS